MDSTDIEMKRELLNCFHSLPKEALPACIWACKHIDYIFSMIDADTYPQDKIEKLIQECFENKDYILMLMLVLKKQHDEKNITQ